MSTDDSMHGSWSTRKQLPGQPTAKVKTGSATPGIPTKGTTIHTLVTSNGSPYLNFQNRIMYVLVVHSSADAFHVTAASCCAIFRRLKKTKLYERCWNVWAGMAHTSKPRNCQEAISL